MFCLVISFAFLVVPKTRTNYPWFMVTEFYLLLDLDLVTLSLALSLFVSLSVFVSMYLDFLIPGGSFLLWLQYE